MRNRPEPDHPSPGGAGLSRPPFPAYEGASDRTTWISREEGAALVALARATIDAHLAGQTPDLDALDPVPAVARGVFVSVESPRGTLRGCLGTIDEPRLLAEEVPYLAVGAATRDHRFPPLSSSDLDAYLVKVSVLGSPVPIPLEPLEELLECLVARRPGLVLECLPGGKRSVFLPEVWEQFGSDARAFLQALCRKQGLPEQFCESTPGRARLFTFETTAFAE